MATVSYSTRVGVGVGAREDDANYLGIHDFFAAGFLMSRD